MGSRLYIGNLSFDTNEDTLRAALTEDGRADSIASTISWRP